MNLNNTLNYSLGSLKLSVDFNFNNSRLNVVFNVDVPEDKVFYHRKNGKAYKPFVGSYKLRNVEEFYVSLHGLLNRDYSYSHNEFNNKDGKGTKSMRMFYNKPSVKNAFGIINDYVASLNGNKGAFIDELKELVSISTTEEKPSYDIFSKNYKRLITSANYRQFAKFALDSYKVIEGYKQDKFSLKEIFSALYPYQQIIIEFIHNIDKPMYTIVYLDYFILDTIKEKIEKTLESVTTRRTSIYGVGKTGKIPILVIEKTEDKREISLFPYGTYSLINESDYILLKKALEYYIKTGIAPRFFSDSGIGIMGGNESVAISVGGKFFNVPDRQTASRILYGLF